MKKFSLKKFIHIFILLLSIFSGFKEHSPTKTTSNDYDKVIYFPSDRYPKTAKHIKQAFKEGESHICTIDRAGATDNRKHSLQGIPTKDGFDRDEFPMAMCEEGGYGADIEYVPYSDNRGAGSWVSHQLSDFKDGTKVLIEIE